MGAWPCGGKFQVNRDLRKSTKLKLTGNSTKFQSMPTQFGAARGSGGESELATDDVHGDEEEHALETSGSA